MNLFDRVTYTLPKGCFLALGAWGDLPTHLAAAGWNGVWVQDRKTKFPEKWDWTWDLWRVSAEVAPDPHFVQTLDGEFVRAVTVQEIFDRFNGPYNAVFIDWPMMTRRIFYSPQIQVCGARFLVIPEDGHNEEVRKEAAIQGYHFDDSVPDYCLMFR